jgi:hypothetical protein
MPAIRLPKTQIADTAGVSSVTVYRVLHGEPVVTDETRAKVLDAIATLGGDPSQVPAPGDIVPRSGRKGGRPRNDEPRDPVSPACRRARRAATQRNRRAKLGLIADGETAGLTETDIVSWLNNEAPDGSGPDGDPWQVVHLFSRPGNEQLLARLRALIADRASAEAG